MFITALFKIGRTWEQPKCPSADEQIKLWYIYTMEYYLAIKRNEFESVDLKWTNLQLVIQSKVSQKEKNKYHILIYMESRGLPCWLSGKESTCQCRRHGFDPWVRKILWRRKWQPLHYSYLRNSMDRGAWQTRVHGVAEELDMTQQLNNKCNLENGINEPLCRTGIEMQMQRMNLWAEMGMERVGRIERVSLTYILYHV